MTSTHPRRSARVLLFCYFVSFLSYGAGMLFFPAALARYTEITLSTPTALADLRAIYGGLVLAVGALFLQALRDPRFFPAALFVALATGAGPALARAYSIAVSGVPNALVLVFLAIELLGFAVTLREYRRLQLY